MAVFTLVTFPHLKKRSLGQNGIPEYIRIFLISDEVYVHSNVVVGGMEKRQDQASSKEIVANPTITLPSLPPLLVLLV